MLATNYQLLMVNADKIICNVMSTFLGGKNKEEKIPIYGDVTSDRQCMGTHVI